MELGLGRTEIGFLKIWLWIPAALVVVAVIIAIPITLNVIGLPYVGLVAAGVYLTRVLAWAVWTANKYL